MRFEIGRGRGKTALMRCFWQGPKAGTIRLSPEALRGWQAGEEQAFWRAILHEVAHLQVQEGRRKSIHHTKPWRVRAAAIGACRFWGGPVVEVFE